MRAPISYYAGKARIAPDVAALISAAEGDTYVEACAGSLAVLYRKRLHALEVVNDVDETLMNFWRVLKFQPEALLARADHDGLYHEGVLERARLVTFDKQQPDLERAWGLFYMSHATYGSLLDAPFNAGKNGLELRRRILHLTEAASRLERVTIRQRDALWIVGRYVENPQAVVYIDPPYLETCPGRLAGWLGWDESKLRALLDLLAQAKCSFALSHYEHPLIEEYATRHGWLRLDIRTFSSMKKNRDRVTECVYHNYRPLSLV